MSVPPDRITSAADPGPGGQRTVVRVTGMDCASCALTIEKHVRRMDGVDGATVNFGAGRLDVIHDSHVDAAGIEAAVRAAGYGVRDPAEVSRAPSWREPRALFALAGLVLFALGGASWWSGVPAGLHDGVFLAAAVIGGLPVYRAALGAVRARSLDINVLMTLAVVGAAAIGAWGEAALVVILFSVSTALQVYAVGRSRDAVRRLADLVPDVVTVRRDGADRTVPAGDVGVGELMVVRPGERLSLDGEIESGASALDEAAITGESIPVDGGPGDAVMSGSVNGTGGLLVRVSRTAEHSTLQRIGRMVEEAQATRAPSEQFVTRFARVYTPVVLAAALVVAVLPPLLGGDARTWFYRALVLLIVSCPCGLVISTPVSVVAGIGAAARRGVLIKGGEALEAAGRLTTVCLDKTGTLTEGRPVVERVVPVDGLPADEALRLAAALERRSEHPLAHAILSAAGDMDLPEVSAFRSDPGRGAEGIVDGRALLIGSPRMFTQRGHSLDAITEHLDTVAARGETPVILGDRSGPLAVFGLADTIRPGAERMLTELRRMGITRLVMLTGDADAPARRVATHLGIEYRAGLLPEDKVAAVEELSAEGERVGMVGDGVNDAPALATARVSFVMGAAGSDAALEAADIGLMADDLGKIPEAIALSRAARRTIRQNIAASLLLNTAFTILAPIGLVPLWLAVLEDAVSAGGVTANSLRLFSPSSRRDPHDERRPRPRAATARASEYV